MTFASVEKGTVLHLFVLASGLMPENQNPAGGLDWNRDIVFNDLSICPDYSSTDAAERFLAILSVDQSNDITVDPESVMLMPIPDDWRTERQGIQANKELSVRDKLLIGRLYPWNRQQDMYSNRAVEWMAFG